METENMQILVKGLPSSYETEHLVRVFYPMASVRTGSSTKGALFYVRLGQRRMAVGMRLEGQCHVKTVLLKADEKQGIPVGIDTIAQNESRMFTKPLQAQLSRMLYDLMKEHSGVHPPWGLLTGVRPVRLLRRSVEAKGERGAERFFLEDCDVRREKYELAQVICQQQKPILAASGLKSYSLYVSIPFCPSRCDYCSFVSRTIEKDAELIDPYMEKLEEELAATARLAEQLGLKLESVYIGGGTPTALNYRQLTRLLEGIKNYFTLDGLAEYTVEAGRPDCTDFEKLAILKQYNVGRISINPQTFSDKVLEAIGRKHTTEDIYRCFEEARRAGHKVINMDLIAGLLGDDQQGFENSVQKTIGLNPENITLHSLTLKRASNIVIDGKKGVSSPGAMVEKAYPSFIAAGYSPYYLYRQKRTVENLENTGWTRKGFEGLYNVFIMEEVHSILSVGAGASTKLVAGAGKKIQRMYNPKFPLDYLQNFDEILAKKKGVSTFYASNLDT